MNGDEKSLKVDSPIWDKNASVARDQTEQAENEKKLRTIYGEKHSRFQELEALIQEKNDTREIGRRRRSVHGFEILELRDL